MKLLFSLLSLLLLASCITQKRCNEKFPSGVIVKDSVRYKTKVEYRDTSITAPADSALLEASVPCPDMPEKAVSSKQASVSVSIKNNRLYAKANCDSLEMELKKIRETITEEQTHVQKEVKVVKEKYIPGFYYFTYWYFFITAGLLLLYFLIRRG